MQAPALFGKEGAAAAAGVFSWLSQTGWSVGANSVRPWLLRIAIKKQIR
ncbi:MAG: hypothetical protein FWH14_07640 [Oscillospiraceae bacterium]|nr:hypothetical protein [Oscillospiraceae bacterium]